MEHWPIDMDPLTDDLQTNGGFEGWVIRADGKKFDFQGIHDSYNVKEERMHSTIVQVNEVEP